MTTISSRRAFKGFTLPEILVTISIAALVGIVVFLVLNAGMTLYAKNTADTPFITPANLFGKKGTQLAGFT